METVFFNGLLSSLQLTEVSENITHTHFSFLVNFNFSDHFSRLNCYYWKSEHWKTFLIIFEYFFLSGYFPLRFSAHFPISYFSARFCRSPRDKKTKKSFWKIKTRDTMKLNGYIHNTHYVHIYYYIHEEEHFCVFEQSVCKEEMVKWGYRQRGCQLTN